MAVVAPLALVGAGLATPAAAAVTTGDIKGVVTFNGEPVDFAKVQLFRSIDRDPTDELRYTRIKTFNTGSSGRFSFSGLKLERDKKNGFDIYRYRVVVTDRAGRAAKTFREVKPKAGRTVTRNVTLQPGATITGSVSRSDGGSPAELTVQIEDYLRETINPELYPDLSTTVAADGTYRLTGLTPGQYGQLALSGGPYDAQCLDTVTNALADCAFTDAQDVVLTTGQARAVPPLTVTKLKPPVSTMTGRVTDTSGRPLKNITVAVSLQGNGDVDDSVKTRSSGRFTLPGLRSGTYTVRFLDNAGRWKSRYLGGDETKGTARRVVVTGGTPVPGLDAQLKSRVSVKASTAGGSGSATVAVSLTRTATGSRPGGTMTLSVGDRTTTVTVVKGKAKATLTGLAAGSQRVTATYSGTSSTAGFTKTYSVRVR